MSDEIPEGAEAGLPEVSHRNLTTLNLSLTNTTLRLALGSS